MNNRITAFVAAAMESVQNEEVLANAQPVDPADADAALGAMDESHREIESAYADQETLEEVHQGLESLAGALEALQDPLNPSAAVFMNIAAEAHLQRVGLDMDDAPIIASFESDAEQSTKLSLDTVKAKMQAIWEAIKKMAEHVMKAITAFFNHVMDANGSLEKRAIALEARLNSIKTVAKETQIDVGHALFARLQVRGELNHPALSQGLTNIASFVEDMGKDPGSAIGQSAKLTLQVLHANSEADVDAVITKLKDIKFDIPQVFAHKVQKDGKTMHTTVEMPGGVRYELQVNEEASADGIAHVRNMIQHASWGRELANPAKAETTADVLTIAEMHNIVKTAKLVAKQGAAMKDVVKKTMTDLEELGKHNADVKAAQVGEAGAKKISDMYSALAKGSKMYMKMVADAAAYSTRVMHGFIGYAEKSLTAYEGEQTADQKAHADQVNEDAAIGVGA